MPKIYFVLILYLCSRKERWKWEEYWFPTKYWIHNFIVIFYWKPLANVETIEEILKKRIFIGYNKTDTKDCLMNMKKIEQFNTKRGKQHSPKLQLHIWWIYVRQNAHMTLILLRRRKVKVIENTTRKKKIMGKRGRIPRWHFSCWDGGRCKW